MNDNKELNDNLERLFSTIKDAYGISEMINAIKEKEVAVKSKDFKILSIIYIGDGCQNIVSEDDIVYIPPNYSILKVKRLSDNQEFEIGDETDEGTIKSFYISENILWVRTEEKGGVVSLNDIRKVPKVFHAVQDKTFDILYDCILPLDHPDNWEVFDKKEDAVDFAANNKKLFSVNDIKDYEGFLWGGHTPRLNEYLFEKAKQKINNQ